MVEPHGTTLCRVADTARRHQVVQISSHESSCGGSVSATVVEPGFFRTELLVEGASSIWPELSIDDYAERTAQTIQGWRG